MNTEDTAPAKSRQKLSICRQIEDMKRKGIKFTIVSEFQAREFLSYNNFYFKLKSFEKNYDLRPVTSPELLAAGITQQYSGLEFAYLQELSKLDMYLRENILSMALSIEHFLRVRLMHDIAENDDEDGFQIVKEYEQQVPDVRERINSKKANSYCESLIDNYPQDLPVWVFLEVISFGDLIKFAKMYYNKYPSKEVKDGILDSLQTVRHLRNAAAHNNCLIHDLHPHNTEFTRNRVICYYVSKINNISEKVREKKMSNRTVHDFITLLYTFCFITTSDGVKQHKLRSLQELLTGRFIENSAYFRGHGTIESTYDFVKKVVDKLVADAYNNGVA